MHCSGRHEFGHHHQSGCHAESRHQGGHCCCGGGTGRHFYTKEEMIKHLEQYLEELRNEVKGVEEHIGHLKSADS